MRSSKNLAGVNPGRARRWRVASQRWLIPALLLTPLGALAQAGAVGDAASAPRFTSPQIEAGREQFHRTCAPCHGRNMVNSGTTSYDLRKFPLDQPERFLQSVTNGRGNMPSFKDALTPEQFASLWAYVGSRGGKEP